MPRPYQPYIPRNASELLDLLGSMMLSSPTFADKTGYLPGMSLETTFVELNEGLQRLRSKLGEERYRKLAVMSDQMRAYFESDPEDKTGNAIKGREVILDMENLIKSGGSH